MNTRSRGWCFTSNNYDDNDIVIVEELQALTSYMIYGKEVAPTTNTKHLQGYLYFDNAKSFSKILKLLPKGSHIEVAKGNAQENREYCIKENDYKEFGTIPAQGKRSDIDLIKLQINEGRGMREICETASNYQSIRTAELLLKYKEKKRNWKPNVIWIYGDSGTGKTRMVYDKHSDIYRKTNSNGKWWDGYDGHEIILIDDVKDTSKEYYSSLLEWLDRYDVLLECKGGSRQILAKTIYLTSIWSPNEMYQGYLGAKELLRRIDTIIHLDGNQASLNALGGAEGGKSW